MHQKGSASGTCHLPNPPISAGRNVTPNVAPHSLPLLFFWANSVRHLSCIGTRFEPNSSWRRILAHINCTHEYWINCPSSSLCVSLFLYLSHCLSFFPYFLRGHLAALVSRLLHDLLNNFERKKLNLFCKNNVSDMRCLLNVKHLLFVQIPSQKASKIN